MRTLGQVECITRQLEESQKAMQERVHRLEALRLSLEEVSPWARAKLWPWVS